MQILPDFQSFTLEDYLAYLFVLILFGLLGRYVNKTKGRSKYNGLMIGLFFGILGVIILALRPKAKPKQSPHQL
jgi:asparagine N-glycosylation enzyme membrane subunit Stt3|tara:strand:- start:670 stop:891 length:222 start_codon:yes stop_codon:yes gene_type:complete